MRIAHERRRHAAYHYRGCARTNDCSTMIGDISYSCCCRHSAMVGNGLIGTVISIRAPGAWSVVGSALPCAGEFSLCWDGGELHPNGSRKNSLCAGMELNSIPTEEEVYHPSALCY